MYSTMIETSLAKYSSMTENLMENQADTEKMFEENTIYYMDEMIRKKNINGSYQEDLLSVRVKWSSPHPSVGVF